MKKGIIIALCSLAIAFVACKKPVEPTPVNYAENYVGSYMGQFSFTITSLDNTPQTGFEVPPIDNIVMDIAKGSETNTITATVTVDNKSYQASGSTTEEKAVISLNGLVIDETHQLLFPYYFDVDLLLEGTKAASDTLNIDGTFSGSGRYTMAGVENPVEEVSGTVKGKLVKQ